MSSGKKTSFLKEENKDCIKEKRIWRMVWALT